MVIKNIFEIVRVGAQVVGRAFFKAVREEIKTSGHAAASSASKEGKNPKGQQTRRAASTNAKLGISLQESIQILNLKGQESLNPEEVQKNYDYLFKINDKSNGGTLYIQSKVFRAKERIDEELKMRDYGSSESTTSDSSSNTKT